MCIRDRFFAVWTTCLFIKVSLGLYLFSLCVKKFFGQKAAKFSIFLGAAAVFAYSLWTVYHENVTFFIYQMSGIFWITVTAALAVPLILLAIALVNVLPDSNGITNPGFHGLSQVLYEYSSSCLLYTSRCV